MNQPELPAGASTAHGLYLRLLYSDVWAEQAQQMPLRPWNAFTKGLSWDRLTIERRGRQRNLAFALQRAASSVWTLLDNPPLELVGRFCDSEQFWACSGRTMPENFALFLHAEVPLPTWKQGVVETYGVLSGMAATRHASPWDGHLLHRGTDLSEQFETAYPTLSGTGALLSDPPTMRRGRYRTTVVYRTDGTRTLACEEVHA